MNKVECDIKVYENVVEITPAEGIKDNYIYEIKIRRVKALNKAKVAENVDTKICTKLTPSYCSLEGIKSLVEAYEIPDDKTLYFIREASLFAEYIRKESFKEGSVPFEVNQYVKYKAAYDSLLKFYIESASDTGSKGSLGEISFEVATSFPALKDLLKSLKDEVEAWKDSLRGFDVEGRVAPTSAVRSSKHTPPNAFGIPFSGRGFSRGVR